MVNIAQSDFNKEIDGYIDNRRKKDYSPKKKKKSFKDTFAPKGEDFFDGEEQYEEKPRRSFLSKLFSRRMPTEEEIEEQTSEMPEEDKEKLMEMEQDLKETQELDDEI